MDAAKPIGRPAATWLRVGDVMANERAIAESLVEFADWWERRISPFEPHPYGEPIHNPPQLCVYGPVETWNVHSGVRLLQMYFGDKLRAVENAWAKLPPDVRQRVAMQAALIRMERLCAEIEGLSRNSARRRR
jgi:hypothetical protein